MLCLTVGVGGCGRFKKPATVVHSLYMDCNNGEYPKARNLFVASFREDTEGALNGHSPGIKGVCDRLSNSGSIADVEITSEIIHGTHAIVVADVRFNTDVIRKGERTELLQEDGAWKVNPKPF